MRELPPVGATDRNRDFAINELIRGRSNATGTVTLTASSTTTTIRVDTINTDAQLFLFPRTAAAATELGAGTIYGTVTAAGTVSITHANSASTTRTFGYLVVGG